MKNYLILNDVIKMIFVGITFFILVNIVELIYGKVPSPSMTIIALFIMLLFKRIINLEKRLNEFINEFNAIAGKINSDK